MWTKPPALAASILGLLAILGQTVPVEARLLGEPVVARPAAQPAPSDAASAQPAPATVATASASGCCTPEPVCCPTPCIAYRHCGPKLCCGDCRPGTDLVLKVKNPCTGCESDVTVCLPACCTGDPTLCEGTGFLGRNVLVYEWCCGYSVRVAFKHCGDILVTTWGR
jgi:hypothetical protein